MAGARWRRLLRRQLATEAPERELEWERLEGEGFEVWYEATLDPPESVWIELDAPPRRHLKVHLDGKRWGRRGIAVRP